MARLAAALLALALVAPAAAGAATWSAPQALVTSLPWPGCCGSPGFTADGTGAAVFVGHSFGEHSGGWLANTHLLTRAPGGQWTDHVTRPGARQQFEALHLRVMPDGGLLVLGSRRRRDETDSDSLYHDHGLAARFGHLSGDGVVVDSRQVLLRKPPFESFDFASNVVGDAVAAWGVRHGKLRGVYVRRARGGGHFGPRRRLTVRPGWALVTAAVGRGGHVLVTWLHGGRVRGRIARPGGGFGPVLDLGPDGRHYIAVGPNGRVLVATLHRVARFRDTLEVTLTGPMGAAPVTTRLVGSSESVYGVSPISRFDRAGRALVAWTDGGDTHVATFAAGPPTVETIEPAGVLDAMEVARSGRVALALRAPTQPSGEGEFVALRGRSGSFGQGEQATPGELRPEGASLAFDPLTGEPNLFYLQREVEDEPIDGAYVVERNGG